MKICNVCKKEVPNDSHFCQYCGSNDVIVKVEQKIVSNDDNKLKGFSPKFVLVLSILVLSLVCNLFMLNQITELKKNNVSLNDSANSYKVEKLQLTSKYDSLMSSIKNIKTYDGFYVNKTILFRPNSERLLVTFNQAAEYQMTSHTTAFVDAEWGEWINDDTCELFITCKTTGFHYVEITNDGNNQIIKILIINE